MGTVAVAIFGALGVACGGSGDDGGGSNSADMTAAPAAASSATIAPGDYVLDNASVGATLTIHSATAQSVSYSLGILGKTGSQHNGELDHRTAAHSGTGYLDTVDADCKITIAAASGGIALKQTGPCSDAGFGAFLDGSGTYKKKTGAGWVGLYETETTHRSWAIRITSESPFTFRLVAGHHEDKSEFVDAKNLVGQLSGDKVLYENGPDCSIELKKGDKSIHVTQTGTCTKLGFPETGDLEMGDDQGTDMSRIDDPQCFDIKDLAVGVNKAACKTPL
jgi:hypothetical protein